MDSDSDDDLMMGYLLLRNQEQRRKHRLRWVHDINQKRSELGEFHHLVKELNDHTDRFFTYFRMSQEKFEELFTYLEPVLQRKNTSWRRSISVKEQMAICLRFLSTGDSFTTIAYRYRCGISTISETVYKVCDAIWQIFKNMFLPPPTEDIWRENAKSFEQRWNFPHCMGAIDGKHIVIQAPPNSGSIYFNYKGTFSIVLMAIVDASYKFTAVDIGAFGSNSDGGIFARSNMGKALEINMLNVPQAEVIEGAPQLGNLPYVIVGDEAFALKSYLLRPYPGKNLAEDKRIFNYRLSRARRISENAFGLLTQRWRIYQRRLNLLPENVEKVVKATIILHNFLQQDFARIQDNTVNTECQPSGMQHIGGIVRGYRATASAMEIRDKYKTHFSSPQGEVQWQYAIIRGEGPEQ